jgi:hypothetical protein
MLDLNEITEDFIRTRLRGFATETDPDVATVRAIADKDMKREKREKQVLIFLRYYKVIRFFPPENSRTIARRIVEFADEPRPTALDQNRASIISEYKKLEGRIQSFAPRTKAGKQIKVTSLTSKALWCCYPDDIPIFDSHAQRALQMISRICRIFPEPGQGEYGRFVDVWLQLYRKIEPAIDRADLKGFPCKIRVLDGLLWYLGKPEFDLQGVDMCGMNEAG